MKKILLLSLMLLAVTFGTQAQNYRYGAKGGVSYSSLTNTDGINPRAGLHGGIQFMYGVYQPIALQVELLYNARGYVTEANVINTADGSTSTQFRNRFHYFDLPLLFRYKFGHLFVEAGPQASVLFRAREVLLTRTNSPGLDEVVEQRDESLLPQMRKLDYSVAAGFGFAVNKSLEVSARYNHGLRTVWKDRSGAGSPTSGGHVNTWFQVSLAYYIPNFSQQQPRPGIGL